MSEETNHNSKVGSAAESPDKGLARALEVLVAHAPFRNSAQYNSASGFTSPAAGSCPEIGDWFRLDSGDVSPEERNALLAHAALCTGCLARLRDSQLALSDEITPEESAALQHYASTSPQWQRHLAVQLSQTDHGAQRVGNLLHFAWLSGVVAAVLVLALSLALWWRNQTAPEKLLAQAYTQARTIELRVPGAGFSPVIPQAHLRGGTTDREPVPLLTARAEIERKLEESPADAHWLQLQARAEMLEEHYDGAIDILDRLLAAGPVTAGLLLDDGTAYYMRGSATGSENDRATALDNLRRADELAPNDPVVLFNEAIVMEDRGQVMNAVETWNRFLKFERDVHWQDEGRLRLQSLEEKLNRVKTHESRMQQHLATPHAMRALAADPSTLAGIDEEFSTTLLPRLLDAAFPLPVDRSRGSPCDEACSSARTLLDALAASLQRNHQDSWLKEFLSSDSSPIRNEYIDATHALGQAIDADTRGDYAGAEKWAVESRDLFRKLGNVAGADRAQVESAYALQRSYTFATCQASAESVLGNSSRFGWIQAQATELDAQCNVKSGSAAMDNPLYQGALDKAIAQRYVLLELRARNALASAAVESGDTETAWRLCMTPLRKFYEGDYPPLRAAATMGGLASVEDSTPRVRLDLLLNREAFHLFSLSKNSAYLAEVRALLIRAALRAGSIAEAKEQMRIATEEGELSAGSKGPTGARAETEIAMAKFYIDRDELSNAEVMLDEAQKHMAGEDNPVEQRGYAGVRGELELALKHPEAAETMLRAAILKEELEAKGAGDQNIVFARQDRDLYATLAGVWLQEGRPAVEILALWERYRLRILGLPVQNCAGGRVDCLKSEVASALDQWRQKTGQELLVGQIVLRDRVLIYHVEGDRLDWSQHLIRREELLAAAASLERVVSSPATSQISVDQAARRLGDILFANLQTSRASKGSLAIEPDPLLGNVAWAAVEAGAGPLGLQLDLEEVPSVLLDHGNSAKDIRLVSAGRPLIVGASVTPDGGSLLPEALEEARMVASNSSTPNLLLASQATEARVAPRLESAPLIHFAGHATQYRGATRLMLAPSGLAGDKPYVDSTLFRQDPPKSARLVVFSACASGKREEGWDHGMGDIVDTLASLGVPEVVATRWQIDSTSAVLLMDAFYRGLSNGLDVPSALTAARQSLVRDARYRHPYYWAAYYASGTGTTDLHEVFHGNSN
jgi:tetratricopeptide (TPR) repeat protein